MPSPSISKLNDDNYSKWAMAMGALLVRRGLWDVTTKPADETKPMGSENSKPVKGWRSKVAEARAEIILNVEPTQYAHINSDDANTVWTALRDVHLARGFGTRVSRRRAFWRMSKRPDQSITAWVADIRRAAFRLKDIEATVTDEDIILVLTNGLPASYVQVIVNLDSTDPDDLTVDYVITRLLNEEARQALVPAAPAEPIATAYTATMKPPTPISRITCYRCGRKGHYERDCPVPPPPEHAATAFVADKSAPAPKYEAW